MALPSARRPRAVEEVLVEEQKIQQSASLKFKIKKEDAFIRAVGDWYKGLSIKEKMSLTQKRLKRRALHEAFVLSFPIQKFPPNWIDTLRKDYGVVFYKKKKSREERYGLQNVHKPSSAEIRRYGPGGRNSKISLDEDVVDSGLPTPPMSPVSATGVQMKMEVPDDPPKPVAAVEIAPKAQPKKMIDLTNEPPPGWWLQAFAKGIVLPRSLEIHSDADMTILFYDYETKPKEDKAYKQVPHDKILKFDWWAKETKDAERKLEKRSAVGKGRLA